MHNSVITATEHRDRERARMRHNRRKRQSQELMRMMGVEPSFTPAHPDGNRVTRQAANREERKMRRFLTNLAFLPILSEKK